MLVCKIELWPGGNEVRAREIGRVLIANVGGDQDTGHYAVQLMRSPEYSAVPGPWRTGRVENFKRLRLGPYDLLLRALAACVGKRSPAALRMISGRDFGEVERQQG